MSTSLLSRTKQAERFGWKAKPYCKDYSELHLELQKKLSVVVCSYGSKPNR
jgi:hypothetical protein